MAETAEVDDDSEPDGPTDEELREHLAALLNEAGDTLDRDILIVAGAINDEIEDELIESLEKKRDKRPNALVMLMTYGGDPDSAFRMTRALQQAYKHLTLQVLKFCKSAGTLVAVGMHEIVMSNHAELGPLDVQVNKPDEFLERTSGLTPRESFDVLQLYTYQTFEKFFLDIRTRTQISTRASADIAAQLAVGLFGPIYEQIDPMRLGEMQRAMSIASQYGDLLNSGNLKDHALFSLCNDYPSHGFCIDRKEAETLFKRIRSPSAAEYELQRVFQPHALEYYRTGIAKYVSPPNTGRRENEPGEADDHPKESLAPGKQASGSGESTAAIPTEKRPSEGG